MVAITKEMAARALYKRSLCHGGHLSVGVVQQFAWDCSEVNWRSRKGPCLEKQGRNMSESMYLPTILHVGDDENDRILVGIAGKRSNIPAKVISVEDGEKAISYLK